jgi:UDP-N-acetyl-D-glucosamine dehydrogenase
MASPRRASTTGGGVGNEQRADRTKWGVLREQLAGRSARVGVIGLGYVGLPVAVDFSRSGFPVMGVDTSRERVAAIRKGRSYLTDVDDRELQSLQTRRQLEVNSSYQVLTKADVVLICVPTPLKDGAPDLSAVERSAKGLAKVMNRGMLVILESTTYPGTTEELLRPLLETRGLVAGKDFLLAFSPERIDPGNPNYSFRDIPKVVGGINHDSTRAAQTLYEQVVSKVVTVSTPREAEMSKLIENIYRHVNIALINELAIYAHELGIDIWESIEAASTKPFGYEPFWPSPGWGGHCIPLDPSYLSYTVRRHRSHDIRFVEVAQAINSEMPRHVMERVSLLLNERGQALRGSRVLGVGAAYKPGTEDTRNSPGVYILEMLGRRGARVSYHDPLVQQISLSSRTLRSVPLTRRRLGEADLVIAFVRQTGVDWDYVAEGSSSIFDCCNAFHRRAPNIHRL